MIEGIKKVRDFCQEKLDTFDIKKDDHKYPLDTDTEKFAYSSKKNDTLIAELTEFLSFPALHFQTHIDDRWNDIFKSLLSCNSEMIIKRLMMFEFDSMINPLLSMEDTELITINTVMELKKNEKRELISLWGTAYTFCEFIIEARDQNVKKILISEMNNVEILKIFLDIIEWSEMENAEEQLNLFNLKKTIWFQILRVSWKLYAPIDEGFIKNVLASIRNSLIK